MKRRLRGRPAAFVLIAALILTAVCPQQAAAKSALRLNRKKATLNVGASLRLKVKGTKKKVKWTTSKKKVAAVSQKGKVTGKKGRNGKDYGTGCREEAGVQGDCQVEEEGFEGVRR